MTFTRMREGSGSEDAFGWERGQLHVDVHTENYGPLASPCLRLMQRNWLFGTRISTLDGIKSKYVCKNKLVL